MNTGFDVKQWCSEMLSRPLELVVGLSVFAAVAAGGAVAHVSSTALGILLLASLVFVRSWRLSWQQLSFAERFILVGFGLYFFSSVISYINVNDEHIYFRHLGRYAKFLFVIPVYLMVSRAKFNIWPFLVAGALVSGPIYLATALLSVAENSALPAKGSYHHITFGDLAMLNALFMSVLLVTFDANKTMEKLKFLKIALFVSIACLLYASILSQARGAWLALPACLLLLLGVAVWYGKIRKLTILVALVALGVVVSLTPAKDIVSSRMQSVTDEIESFQKGVERSTSIGDRLAMWHIAVDVWKEHPLIGSGPGDFSEDIKAIQAQGMYGAIQPHETAHNIYLHALATTGAFGFVILCVALLLAPFRLFYKSCEGGINVAGLCGMVVLVAFAVFGLTETWVLRSPPIAIFLLYFVALASAISQSTKTDK